MENKICSKCITSLPNDKAEAISADFGTSIKPTPVTDKATDVVLAPKMANLSTDCKTDVRVF